MRRFLAIIFFSLFTLSIAIVYAGDISDLSNRFSGFTVYIPSKTASVGAGVVVAAKGSRKKLVLMNYGPDSTKTGTLVWIGYESTVTSSSGTGFLLHPYTAESSSTVLILENYIGPLYGIGNATTTITGWEQSYE